MFGDELFDIADFGDFGSAEDVVEIADFGGGEEFAAFDLGDAEWASADADYWNFADSGAEGTQMFGDELSYDTGSPFDLGADEWAAQDAAYATSEPTFSWDQGSQYPTAIGPGLNGTPMSPVGQSDGGVFGGIKSALGAIFNGNPNNAAMRQNSTVYGRQTLYRNGQTVYAGQPTGTASNPFAAMLQRITGGSAGSARGGIFGTSGGDNTAMFIMAGVALLGVALLAKR